MMGDFISQDVSTYFHDSWDVEGQSVYDYLAQEFPTFEEGAEGLRNMMRIETCRINDTLFLIYAIEWLDESGSDAYPIRFDTGHIVYDIASGEIVDAEHTNRSSLEWKAYDLRVSLSDCDWWLEQEEKAALR